MILRRLCLFRSPCIHAYFSSVLFSDFGCHICKYIIYEYLFLLCLDGESDCIVLPLLITIFHLTVLSHFSVRATVSPVHNESVVFSFPDLWHFPLHLWFNGGCDIQYRLEQEWSVQARRLFGRLHFCLLQGGMKQKHCFLSFFSVTWLMIY